MCKKLLYLFIALSLTCTLSVFAAAPENLCTAKKNVIRYYESGAYEHDVQTAVLPGETYLKNRVSHNTDHKKLAIVFDIDDTIVSTYDISKNYDFGATKRALADVWTLARNTPILPTQRLYRYAQHHDVAIFLISGRKQYLKRATIKLLHSSGYNQWTKLYLKPKNIQSTLKFKTEIRKEIIEDGYDIVLNVGDQYSDLKGGYADMSIKLPNPLYIV